MSINCCSEHITANEWLVSFSRTTEHGCADVQHHNLGKDKKKQLTKIKNQVGITSHTEVVVYMASMQMSWVSLT